MNQRHRRAEAIVEAPLANLQALVFNIGGRPDKPVKAEDFMRSTWGRTAQPEITEAERNRSIAEKFRAFGRAAEQAQAAHGR